MQNTEKIISFPEDTSFDYCSKKNLKTKNKKLKKIEKVCNSKERARRNKKKKNFHMYIERKNNKWRKKELIGYGFSLIRSLRNKKSLDNQ